MVLEGLFCLKITERPDILQLSKLFDQGIVINSFKNGTDRNVMWCLFIYLTAKVLLNTAQYVSNILYVLRKKIEWKVLVFVPIWFITAKYLIFWQPCFTKGQTLEKEWNAWLRCWHCNELMFSCVSWSYIVCLVV